MALGEPSVPTGTLYQDNENGLRTEVKKTGLTFHARQQVLWHSCPNKRCPLLPKAAGLSHLVSVCASIGSDPQLARNTQSWAPPCSLHFEERSRWRNCMSKLESQPAGAHGTEICAHGHKLLITFYLPQINTHMMEKQCAFVHHQQICVVCPLGDQVVALPRGDKASLLCAAPLVCKQNKGPTFQPERQTATKKTIMQVKEIITDWQASHGR